MRAASTDLLSLEAWKDVASSAGRSKKCRPNNTEQYTAYFDEKELQTRIKENIRFHQLGGNLKSVQTMLDQAMDTTIEQLGLTFVPKENNNGNSKETKKFTTYLRGYYDTHPSRRSGYGEPLPGQWDKEQSKVLMGKRWFDVIEPRQGRVKWDVSLGPIGPTCRNLVQLGNKKSDGYKFICLPSPSSPAQQANNINQKIMMNSMSGIGEKGDGCHVISVGGNDNWKFEEAVQAQLGCTTYTFDCTLPGGKPRRKPKNDNIKFFNYCIDGHAHNDTFGREYVTYSDMLQIANLHQPPTYFKIDVEGFEYDIFSQMIRDSPDLLPLQIQVELHWASRMTGLSWMPRTRSAAEVALLSSMMFSAGHYLPIQLDFNPYCTTCMEVLYFRANDVVSDWDPSCVDTVTTKVK